MKIDHSCIIVDDFERSLRFYQEVLNLEIVQRMQGTSIRPGKGEIDIAFLQGKGGSRLELVHFREATDIPEQMGKLDHINILTEDFEEALARFERHDVTFLQDPIVPEYRDDVGRIVFIEDPEGVKIEVTEVDQL